MTQNSNSPGEALKVYDEQLQFAAKVIASSDIPNSVRTELGQYIHNIHQRRQDPKLYLAVIGEFSSGKSTLINALLRNDLLKTSALVATSTATRLVEGKAIAVEVQFKNPQQPPIKVNLKNKVKVNHETGKITVNWLPWSAGLDIEQFIHQITSNDSAVSNIAGVTITHPALFLKNGVVIIDTPGANTENPQHAAITCQVVEKETDAAIITVPATQPLSKTLIDFLAGSLHPYLHRCVFVVTKMDLIRTREQSKLIDNIRDRLQQNLGINQPIIFACAPQVVLDALNGKEIASHLQDWKAKFLELETALKKRLRQERAISITESGLRLLTQLFEQLDSYLQLQWEQYKIRQEAIRRETIPDLPTFVAQEKAICRQIIEEAISTTIAAIAQCVESHRETSVSKIKAEIFNTPDVKALNSIVETGAKATLNEEQQFFQKEVQKNLEKLSTAGTTATCYLDKKFSEVYRRLQSLAGEEVNIGSANVEVLLNTSETLSSMQSHNQEIGYNDLKLSLGGGGAGAAAGAAIGTFMLPGIGTAVGSALGGTIGLFVANFFSTALDKRQQELWEKLHPSLNNYFDTAKQQAVQLAQNYGQGVTIVVEQRIDAYGAKYKAVVKKMQDEQKKELLRLTMLQEKTGATLQEIEQRRKCLSEQLQELSNKF